MGDELYLSVLGPIRAWRGGTPVPLGRVGQRAVLGLLALAGERSLTRAELVDALWPDAPPPSAANVIQTHLKRLRQALEPERPARAPSAVLPAVLLGSALELWQGPPLADVAMAVPGEVGGEVGAASPFFIVGDLLRALEFYRDRLGFEVTFTATDAEPFFATVHRDGVQFLLKVVGDGVGPQSNRTRHPYARWDAFIYAPDPDELAAEFDGNGVTFSAPLADTDDGLRGFEVADADGYLLFFGRPREKSGADSR